MRIDLLNRCKKSFFASCFAMFCMCLSQNVSARTVYPFYLNNQNPFIQIFGLPRPQPAELLNSNGLEQITSLDIVNNTVQGSNAGEKLVLDGESYRLNLAYRYTYGETEYAFQVPFVRHTSGRFDNFIRNWHHFFGMSNDEQRQFKANQLSYFYQDNSGQIINIDSATSSIGDIQFSIAHELKEGDTPGAAKTVIRASLKLPTGNPDKLTGSGAPDLAVAIASQNDALLSRFNLGLYGQAGVLWTGSSDLFSGLQRRTVAFGTAVINWYFSRHIEFRTQLDLHSSFYNSSIVDIGGNSVQLNVGGTVIFAPQHRLDIGVTENLFSDATPDIGLNLVYRHLF